MYDLVQKLATWREEQPGSPEEEFIGFINRELLASYPGLILRWSKIYGSRWAHLCGNNAGIAMNPVKVALNHDYGICIDNPDMLGTYEVDRLVIILKECFADVPVL